LNNGTWPQEDHLGKHQATRGFLLNIENEPLGRDLFGELVTATGKRRRQKIAALVSPAEQASPMSGEPPPDSIRLRLPSRLKLNGALRGNPVRQFGLKEGYLEGILQRIEVKRLSAFRFVPRNGAPVLIVPRKTTADLGVEQVLLLDNAQSVEAIQQALEKGDGKWLSPKPQKVGPLSESTIIALCEQVLKSWKDQFAFREGTAAENGTPASPGLRRPQVGALHAALAHATSSTEPATIVMPTGTGKTETMLAIFAYERFSRLMVVVPTDALREQIAQKFETMGVLQDQLCLSSLIEFPIVLRMEHIPKSAEDVDAIFSRANVVVTTMSIAGRAAADVQERMAQLCGALFIDEAHHISARTWREFRAWFTHTSNKKPVYQFTATPFREDGGKVDGRFIYYYPLAKAQAEDYFGKIRFAAVSELDGPEADNEILRQVGEALKTDLAKGYNHVAMVRCKTIGRSETLYSLYCDALPQYNPVIVNSKQTSQERRDNLAKLRRFESRIIVCVDMLGEGFDLPELKIAGVHDVFGSIAVTLQFVGRFARARTDLGEATLIANTDQDRVDRALSKLYAEEADWNFLISSINADRVGREMERAAVFAGFTGDLTEIPLQTIESSMNTLVFLTNGCGPARLILWHEAQ
jgi:superfamily II DNA or RNA helicase